MATINQILFPIPENVDCPNCRESIKLYDPEGSEFCVCQACNSFISFTKNVNKGVAQKQAKKIKAQPIIPLGKMGSLKGHQFVVIAYLEKKEKDTTYTWEEYLLYNYEKGYVTLAVFDGHWNYIIDKTWDPELEAPQSEKHTTIFKDQNFQIFNVYTPVTTALIGEFDWDVLSDQPKTYEYIYPPYSISKEVDSPNSKADLFYLGEYIEPEEIAAAFELDVNAFPSKEGIGANQLSSFAKNFGYLSKFTMAALCLMLVIYIIISVTKPEKELMNRGYNIAFENMPNKADSSGSTNLGQNSYEFKPFTTSSFVQDNGNVPLEIAVGSGIDNNWIEATIILVNERTNETWEVTKGAEYYHGYEGGESWTEGSRESSIILTEIPEGKYHLNIYPASGDPNQNYLNIRITSNVTLWKNILLLLFLLIAFPIFSWYRMRLFDKERWMNSDYSPYEYES